MENIEFDFIENQGFHIKHFPDAEKVIKLEGNKAQELADIALCRSDLLRAKEYLLASQKEEKGSTAQDALWKMAIISFLKGFGKNNARDLKLDISEVLSGDKSGQVVFNYFKDTRDKNVAHDDNSISQCMVGAILNKANSPFKIAKIITMNLHGSTYEKRNITNLERLIETALVYVEDRYEKLCAKITADLEALSPDQLVKMGALNYKAPIASEFGQNRGKLSSSDSKT